MTFSIAKHGEVACNYINLKACNYLYLQYILFTVWYAGNPVDSSVLNMKQSLEGYPYSLDWTTGLTGLKIYPQNLLT